MKGLDGKVAIVTGAAQGIGRAITERLLDERMKVLAVDLKTAGLDTVKSSRGELAVLELNLVETDAPKKVISTCLERFSAIDLLVNNAGVGTSASMEETSDELYDSQLDINLRVAFRLSRDCLPELKRSAGSIVNIASATAVAGYPFSAAYVAAKGGMISMARNVAAQYGSQGIRANVVAPGLIETPMTREAMGSPSFIANVIGTMPLGKVGRPEDVASCVAFLGSDEARMISGQVIAVDGGQTASVYLSEAIVAAWESAAERQAG